MAKYGKRTTAAREQFAGKRNVTVDEAVALVKNNAKAKFDETVEIAMNLFSEVSVLREWGTAGGRPKAVVQCFGNLREASRAADIHRSRAERRGYLRS